MSRGQTVTNTLALQPFEMYPSIALLEAWALRAQAYAPSHLTCDALPSRFLAVTFGRPLGEPTQAVYLENRHALSTMVDFGFTHDSYVTFYDLGSDLVADTCHVPVCQVVSLPTRTPVLEAANWREVAQKVLSKEGRVRHTMYDQNLVADPLDGVNRYLLVEYASYDMGWATYFGTVEELAGAITKSAQGVWYPHCAYDLASATPNAPLEIKVDTSWRCDGQVTQASFSIGLTSVAGSVRLVPAP